MTWKILCNDIKRNRFLTLTTLIFIAAAALLISLAMALLFQLTGSIDHMMARARTPHFMQMHTGNMDVEALGRFAAENAMVEEFQVLDFLNIDNGKIRIGDSSFENSTQDNGFTTQSMAFDYLLDMEGNVIMASGGELYVPAGYSDGLDIKIGDRAEICGLPFTVAGFLRDSQMNSMLSSSKRFLVSKEDFDRLSGYGSRESLIEFRLRDVSDIDAFAAAYTAAGLPSNGPAVTWPLFRMINAVSDGIMIGLILLAGMVVTGIALLCVRFTLLTKIEEDYREIGVMKAIGIRMGDIKRLYISEYALTASAGCLSGLILSFAVKKPLLTGIIRAFGTGEGGTAPFAAGLAGVSVLFLTILAFAGGVLRRFRKISAAEAVRTGGPRENGKYGKGLPFFLYRLLNLNILMGLRDVRLRIKLYATSLSVLIFAVFIMILPQKLYHTVSSGSFVTYMGIGDCDLRVDIQQSEEIQEKAGAIAEAMRADRNITKSAVLLTKAFRTLLSDGSAEKLQVELGDHSAFPVAYTEGRAPLGQEEIALSVLLADGLGKKVGDGLILETKEGGRRLTVCGLYSDITNGGKTAKAAFSDESGELMRAVIYAAFSGREESAETVRRYTELFPAAKVTDLREFVRQTWGPAIASIRRAGIAAAASSFIVLLFIHLLFQKLLVAKDRYSIAVMKATGYSSQDIRLQYLTKALILLIPGIGLGGLLAGTLGEALSGAILSSMGAASFRFAPVPFYAKLLIPLTASFAVTAAAARGSAGVSRIRICENLKE